MVDYIALNIAMHMFARPSPGAKMSGGDLPRYDADMDYWLNNNISVYSNPGYIYSKESNFSASGIIGNEEIFYIE